MTSTSGTSPTIRDPATVVSELIGIWTEYDFRDEDLWEAFRLEFEGYTENDFKDIPKSERLKFRNFLRKLGVYLPKKDNSITISRSFYNLLLEEEPAPWTEEEITKYDDSEEFTSRRIRKRIASDFGRKSRTHSPYPTPVTSTPPPPPPPPGPAFPPGSSLPPAPPPPPPGPTGPITSNNYGTPTPPGPTPGVGTISGVSGYGKELANLVKMYNEEAKYSGEDDSFSYKLTIFNDICDRADIPYQVRLKAFPTMLKGLALDYYYSNISLTNAMMTFDNACFLMRTYFEGAEYKRGILSRWNGMTLKLFSTRPAPPKPVPPAPPRPATSHAAAATPAAPASPTGSASPAAPATPAVAATPVAPAVPAKPAPPTEPAPPRPAILAAPACSPAPASPATSAPLRPAFPTGLASTIEKWWNSVKMHMGKTKRLGKNCLQSMHLLHLQNGLIRGGIG